MMNKHDTQSRINQDEENSKKQRKACGLLKSYHGVVYQIQWIMTVALHARKTTNNSGFTFKTEEEENDVGKFDDVIWQYRDGDKTIYNFLQCKHKINKQETITLTELLKTANQDKNPFSLQKYFISYRDNIKPNPKYHDGTIENLIIATNIDVDINIKNCFELAQNKNTVLSGIRSIYGAEVNPQCLKINKNRIQPQLIARLQETYDLVKLASELGQNIKDRRKFKLSNDLLKYYYVLYENVVDKTEKRISNRFIDGQNLSVQAAFLREAFFQKMYIKEKGDLKLKKDLFIQNPAEFAEMFVTAITSSKNKVITINRGNFKKLRGNIDMLAGFVLIKADGIKFNNKFWLVHENELPHESFKIFRDILQEKIQSINLVNTINPKQPIAKQLDAYRFQIRNFVTCPQELVDECSFWEIVKDYTGFEYDDNVTKEIEQKCSLPNYDLNYIKKEIEDFFGYLVFALGYSRECLCNAIQSELNADFSCIDNVYVAHAFRIEIGKCLDLAEHKYISTAEEVTNFLNVATQQINGFVLIGPTLEYRAKTCLRNIHFSRKTVKKLKLRSFLTNKSSKQVFIIISGHNKLSSIKIYQILESIQEYNCLNKSNNYIFMQLSTVLYLMDIVIKYFEFSCHLLIIECDTPQTNQAGRVGNQEILFLELNKIITSNDSKRIILISQNDCYLAEKFKTQSGGNVKEISDKRNNLTNLTKQSQTILLHETEVVLQGRKVNLENLLNNSTKELITKDMLFRVISQDTIEIGVAPDGLGKVNDYYIGRTFCRKEAVARNILKEIDLFALSNTNRQETYRVINMIINKESDSYSNIKVRSFEEEDPIPNNPIRYVILNETFARQQFDKLCHNYSTYNIHWLSNENSYYIWQRTKSHLSKVRKHLLNDIVAEYNEKDVKFIDKIQNNKITIISAEAGMGKSTVATNLASKIIPNVRVWVVRINLLHYSSDFKQEVDKRFVAKFLHKAANFNFIKSDKNTIISNRFVSVTFQQNKLTLQGQKNYLNSSALLEIGMFNHLYNNGRVCLILDGYDELCSFYEEKVIKFLNILNSTPVSNIVITTRPYNILYKLENTLAEFSYKLKPFNHSDQMIFLTNYWGTNLQLTEIDRDRAEVFIKELLERFSQATSDDERKFVGIPLQLRMLAYNFQDLYAEFYNSKVRELNELYRSKIEENLDLINLYEKFIDTKFLEIRFQEKNPGLNIDYADMQRVIERERTLFMSNHQKLSIYALFENNLEGLLSPAQIRDVHVLIKSIEDADEVDGIITSVINSVPIFVHQTFAEYFASIYFWTNFKTLRIKDYKNNFLECLILNKIFTGDYVQICRFFYFAAVKDFKSGISILHKDEKMTALLESITNIVTDIYNIYINGGTCQVDGTDDIFKFDIGLITSAVNCNVEYYRKDHYVPSIKLLFKILDSYLGMESQNKDIAKIIENERTINLLRMAAELGCKNFTVLFVNLKKFNYQIDLQRKKWYFTPLWLAAQNNHLKILSFLSNIYDCTWTDKDGMTLMQRIYYKSALNVLQPCLKLNIINTSPYANLNGELELPLATAVVNNYPLDVVKMLIQKANVTEINEFNKHRLTALWEMSIGLLHYETEIAELLIKKGINFSGVLNLCLSEYSIAALHYPIISVSTAHFSKCAFFSDTEFLNLKKIIDIFLKGGVCFNTKDINGTTTLQHSRQIYYIHNLFIELTQIDKPLQTIIKLIINSFPLESGKLIGCYIKNYQIHLPNNVTLINETLHEIIKDLCVTSNVTVSSHLQNLQVYLESAKEEILYFKKYQDSLTYNNIFIGYEEMLEYKFYKETQKMNIYKSLGNIEKKLLCRILKLYIRQNYDVAVAFEELATEVMFAKDLSTWMLENKNSRDITKDDLFRVFNLDEVNINESMQCMASNIYKYNGISLLNLTHTYLCEIGRQKIHEVLQEMTIYSNLSKQIYDRMTGLEDIYNKLIDAIKVRNYNEIKLILQNEENYLQAIIDAQDDEYGSLLHFAVCNRDFDSTRILLLQGANPNNRLKTKGKLLYNTIETKIEFDNEFFYGSCEDFTPIHIAVIKGDLNITQLLLSHKADPTAKTISEANAFDFVELHFNHNAQVYKDILNILNTTLDLIKPKKDVEFNVSNNECLPGPSHGGKKRKAETKIC